MWRCAFTAVPRTRLLIIADSARYEWFRILCITLRFIRHLYTYRCGDNNVVLFLFCVICIFSSYLLLENDHVCSLFCRLKCSTFCLFGSRRNGMLFIAWTVRGNSHRPWRDLSASRNIVCANSWTCMTVSLCTRRRRLLLRRRYPRRPTRSPPEVTCSTDIWTSWAHCRNSDGPGSANSVFRLTKYDKTLLLTISIIRVPESYSKRAGIDSVAPIGVRWHLGWDTRRIRDHWERNAFTERHTAAIAAASSRTPGEKRGRDPSRSRNNSVDVARVLRTAS